MIFLEQDMGVQVEGTLSVDITQIFEGASVEETEGES